MESEKDKKSPSKQDTTLSQTIHKLNDAWVFWYAPRGKRAPVTDKYIEHLNKIGEFDSVEGFFRFYTFLKRPADIDVDNKLMLFRRGANPVWEDWPEGGCWILQFKKNENEIMNQKWELLLFSCIGEQFEDPLNLIGVVISIRAKRNIIELWLRNGKDESKRVRVGEKIRACLDLDPLNLTFYFQELNTALQKQSLLRNAETYTFVRTPMETPMTGPRKDSKDIPQFNLD